MENEPKSAAEDGEVKEDDKEEDEKKKKDIKDGKFVGLVINGTSCEWLVIHPWSSFSKQQFPCDYNMWMFYFLCMK